MATIDNQHEENTASLATADVLALLAEWREAHHAHQVSFTTPMPPYSGRGHISAATARLVAAERALLALPASHLRRLEQQAREAEARADKVEAAGRRFLESFEDVDYETASEVRRWTESPEYRGFAAALAGGAE